MSAPQKIRVIVTRPEPDASAFAAMLAARGMTAILSPVLRIELREIANEIGGAAAVAFTSANGVRSYLAAGGDRGLRAFAVGAATAAAARAGGLETVHSGAGDVAALARQIVDGGDCGSADILHVVGRDEAGDLVGALAARGLRARRVIGYAAEPVGDLSGEAIDALKRGGASVSLFSARSARLLRAATAGARLDGFLGGNNAACLSAAVAAAAGEGWRLKLVATRPDAAALIDAIAGAR